MLINNYTKTIIITPRKTGSWTLEKTLPKYGWVSYGVDFQHETFIPEGFSSYKVILITRNPYSRAVSLWCQFKRENNINIDFITYIKDQLISKKDRYHYYTITDYYNNLYKVDHIIKLEEFNIEFGKLGINIDIIENYSEKDNFWYKYYCEESISLIKQWAKDDFDKFGYSTEYKSNRLEAKINRLEIHVADHCTLKCFGCNHLSPQLNKKLYNIKDYIYWLDKLRNHGTFYDIISLTGGEPFLNPSLIEFVKTIKGYCFKTEICTNLFWLKDEKSIDKYKDIIESVDILTISMYKKYSKYNQKPLLEKLDKLYPDKLFFHYKDTVETFFINNFTEEYLPVIENNCAVKNCTQLLSNGYLYRCPYGRVIDIDGAVPQNIDMTDMVYDIDNDSRNLQDWHDKWEMNCCHHCTLGQGKQKEIEWKEI